MSYERTTSRFCTPIAPLQLHVSMHRLMPYLIVGNDFYFAVLEYSDAGICGTQINPNDSSKGFCRIIGSFCTDSKTHAKSSYSLHEKHLINLQRQKFVDTGARRSKFLRPEKQACAACKLSLSKKRRVIWASTKH